MRRFLLIVVVVVCWLAEGASVRAAEEAIQLSWDPKDVLDTPVLSFAQMSDPHISATSGEAAETLKKAIGVVNALQPDFALMTGDLTSSGQPRQFDAFKEIMEGLKVPLYVVAGNHDADNDHLDVFCKALDTPLHYRFQHKGVHFIALGGAVPGLHSARLSAEDMAAFKADLEAARDADQVFVFCHFNIQDIENWKEQVLPLLAEHRVTAYLHGHTHRLQLSRMNGISFLSATGLAFVFDEHPKSVRMYYVYPERTVVVTVAIDGTMTSSTFASLPNPRRKRPEGPRQEPVRFVVFGDTRSQPEVYRRIVQMAAAEDADFYVSTGDQIAYADRALWQRFLDISRPLMEKAPFYLVPGNHDLAGEGGQELWRDTVQMLGNELYYTFDCGPVHGIVLNTESEDLKTEQFAWLRADLESCKLPYRFLFLHRPMYPAITHLGDSLNADPVFRDKLHLLLLRHGVAAVFAGHVHLYRMEEIGDLAHIITGGGGAPLHGPAWQGGFYHILVVEVGGGRISATLKALNPLEVYTIPSR